MARDTTPMTKSGHCAFPSSDGESHKWCKRDGCVCECHLTWLDEPVLVERP